MDKHCLKPYNEMSFVLYDAQLVCPGLGAAPPVRRDQLSPVFFRDSISFFVFVDVFQRFCPFVRVVSPRRHPACFRLQLDAERMIQEFDI